MSEPLEDIITWVHDCPPGHELRLIALDGQIEATCIELSDEPVPPMSGQAIKWSGVHKVVVDWQWTGNAFEVVQVEVSFIADEDDTTEEPA